MKKMFKQKLEIIYWQLVEKVIGWILNLGIRDLLILILEICSSMLLAVGAEYFRMGKDVNI